MEAYTAQEVFINSEAGFGNAGGNQVDSFKLNFNQQPFESGDDTQLKVSLSQFHMTKNFYDVNATNNTIRMTVAGSTEMTNADALIKLDEADYTNSNMLADELAVQIGAQLTTLFGANVIGNSVLSKTAWVPDLAETPVGGDNHIGVIKSMKSLDKNKGLFKLTFTAPTGKSFDVTPVFQCLQVPPETTCALTGGGLLTAEEQFNDSYVLLGGKRIETFEAVAATQSFTVEITSQAVANDTLTITGTYPMNQEQNTLPYLYLQLSSARNQGTSNLIASAEEHNHEITYSTILAKIPRVMNYVQQVSYVLGKSDTEYFAMLNTRYMNSLLFSITDHRGRPIAGATGNQKSDGNIICDFSVKVEKVRTPFEPNRLVGAPPPPPIPIRGRIPTLPMGLGNEIN